MPGCDVEFTLLLTHWGHENHCLALKDIGSAKWKSHINEPGCRDHGVFAEG